MTYWGKERGLPIEELIRRQTSDTALAMGLTDRGFLKPGLKADINVIDYDNLALEAPKMQYDLPGGGKRLMQRAKGYETTIVSGVVTYVNGQPTGELPGKLVRCQGEQNLRVRFGERLRVTKVDWYLPQWPTAPTRPMM